MIRSIGDEELNGHDDANIPCNIFISEIGEDYEDEVAEALVDLELEGFEPKWILTADIFMPRKGLADGPYRYVADTKEELYALVREHVLPSYKIALDAVTAMADGKRDSFYYWKEKHDD